MTTSAPICDIKVYIDLAELKVVAECHDRYYDTTNEISYSVGELDLMNGDYMDNIIELLLDWTVDEFIKNKKNAGSNLKD